MRIALIGYGKMGKVVEEIALSRKHEISGIIDNVQFPENSIEKLTLADVAIEFTKPGSVVDNIIACFKAGIPVVTGTTGWNHQQQLVFDACSKYNGTLFYASNFSFGVNIFMEINRKLANIMNHFPTYEVDVEEIHHTQKLDAPSGTAITLAEDIIKHLSRKENWVMDATKKPEELKIAAKRINNIPGTHTINYESAVDKIAITHVAKNRHGFGLGAVLAAEFVQDKLSIYGMADMLSI